MNLIIKAPIAFIARLAILKTTVKISIGSVLKEAAVQLTMECKYYTGYIDLN